MALEINPLALLVGIPSEALSDPHIEMVSFLHSIGVRAGVANSILHQVRSHYAIMLLCYQ